MLMRTALAPAASSDSSTAGSREAGPIVASILALLTFLPEKKQESGDRIQESEEKQIKRRMVSALTF
jgi:hypothetical protein